MFQHLGIDASLASPTLPGAQAVSRLNINSPWIKWSGLPRRWRLSGTDRKYLLDIDGAVPLPQPLAPVWLCPAGRKHRDGRPGDHPQGMDLADELALPTARPAACSVAGCLMVRLTMSIS
ncbi:MAG: hypothetical protein IPM67_15210 [Sphingomonadales bacterium]|nr:hypothetical protein [Sphingomonadales bacterium]